MPLKDRIGRRLAPPAAANDDVDTASPAAPAVPFERLGADVLLGSPRLGPVWLVARPSRVPGRVEVTEASLLRIGRALSVFPAARLTGLYERFPASSGLGPRPFHQEERS